MKIQDIDPYLRRPWFGLKFKLHKENNFILVTEELDNIYGYTTWRLLENIWVFASVQSEEERYKAKALCFKEYVLI